MRRLRLSAKLACVGWFQKIPSRQCNLGGPRLGAQRLAAFLAGLVVLIGAGCGSPSALTSSGAATSPPVGQATASSGGASPTASPVATFGPPPVGDSCLPGTWTMSSEDNPSGWSFNGQVVHVTGLAGQVLIITPEGKDTVNWANSQPLVGTFQGRTLTVSLRGNAAADVHGAGGLYSVSNITGALTAAFNWGGTPASTGSVGLVGTQGLPYSCSATQLVVHYPGSITDTFTRTG